MAHRYYVTLLKKIVGKDGWGRIQIKFQTPFPPCLGLEVEGHYTAKDQNPKRKSIDLIDRMTLHVGTSEFSANVTCRAAQYIDHAMTVAEIVREHEGWELIESGQ